MKLIHNKKLRHGCDHCGKIFISLPRLLMHREVVHMQGIAGLCQLCGKDFLGENLLRNHIQKSHSQEQQIADCGDNVEAEVNRNIESDNVELNKKVDANSFSGLIKKVGFN